MTAFTQLLDQVLACNACANHLPHGTRPVLQVHPGARLLIASQAPGRKVHETGVPFSDASGDRLREWIGVGHDVFYDPRQVAILPMGLCFPGTGGSGDLPPRRECAPMWHRLILAHLGQVRLTLVVGRHAQKFHLGASRESLTDAVRNWPADGANIVPLPHPSPRNNIWLARNPWFADEVLPVLRRRVAAALGAPLLPVS